MSKKDIIRKQSNREWWANLSHDEKDAYIKKREQVRKFKRAIRPLPKDEEWSNRAGKFVKHYDSHDSYTVKRII